MKICVSASGKDTALGRAPFFYIIDSETGHMEMVEIQVEGTGKGAGMAAAQTVADDQ